MYNVLIADDELLFRDYLKMAADWDGLDMLVKWEARNGEEALALLEEECPDIALLDINMPIIDGLKLAEIIKERNPKCAVVMVTGHNEFEYARSALRLGIEDYLLKPFNRDELFRALLSIKGRLDQLAAVRSAAEKDETELKERFLYRLVSQESMDD